MDLQELLNTLAGQFAFWSKSGEQPGTLPIVNKTRDAFRETGKVVDDYVLGGTFQANMRGQDALLRQLALNAVAGGVGAGVGVGAAKVVPRIPSKVNALMQWIKPRDIGVHLSPFDDLEKILPNINLNRGAREVPGFPLVKGQTYKLSSINAFNQKLNPKELLESVDNYIHHIPHNGLGMKNIYVTKSPTGLVDPEAAYIKEMYENGAFDIPGTLNSRISPYQKVVGSKRVPWSDHEPIDSKIKNELEELIAKQQSIEKIKSLLRATTVGGTAAGTALTPLVAARPALGFNNRR
jgi:hypothetical protein